MTTMRKFWLAIAALAALAAPARADFLDPPPAYPVYPPVPLNAPPAVTRWGAPVYDWTGFYIGINGGGAFGRTDWQSAPDAASGSVSFSRGIVGGTIGYNAQTVGSLVIGTELDFDWAPLNSTVPPASCAPNCELRTSWLSTARVRFGYAIDRFMPYVTGGVAISDLTGDIVGQPFGTQTAVTFSWTAGAGVEFAVSGPLTAKLEYLYVDHGNIGCMAACNGGPITMNPVENVVRLGINYRIWSQ